MAIFRTLLCALGVVVIAGCASAPTPKPALPGNLYDTVATSMVGVNKCVQAGNMSADAGARGLRYANTALAGYSYDANQLNLVARSREAWKPTTEWCNDTALRIAQRDQQIALNRENSALQQRELNDLFAPNPTVRTTCNRVGTQTLCTSN